MSKEISKAYAANVKYIDPSDCGSTVGYRIHNNRTEDFEYHYAYADVEIADCGRKVNWSFNFENFEDSLVKVDNAIVMLQEFKREFVKASKEFKKIDDIVEKQKAEKETKKVSTKK